MPADMRVRSKSLQKVHIPQVAGGRREGRESFSRSVTYYWTLNLIVTSEKKTPDPVV
jgi:hypothetical protein